MKTFDELKTRLQGLMGEKKEKDPARVAVESLFDESELKVLQTGNFSPEQTNALMIIASINQLLFNIESTASHYDFFDDEVRREFRSVYLNNNEILRKIFLISKSKDAKGIEAIMNMFSQKYIYNEGIRMEEIKHGR
jgi:hypothetical protein